MSIKNLEQIISHNYSNFINFDISGHFISEIFCILKEQDKKLMR